METVTIKRYQFFRLRRENLKIKQQWIAEQIGTHQALISLYEQTGTGLKREFVIAYDELLSLEESKQIKVKVVD
jgi:predicted transcriptional regulator